MEARAALIYAQNPANDLRLDEQGITLDQVPDAEQSVRLKYLANMNQGATAFDITDDIHFTYVMWIECLAKELNQCVFALDVMTTDYTAPPTPQNAWALEINGEPY